MKNIIKGLLISLFVLFLFPISVYAGEYKDTEVSFIKETDNEYGYCIDLEEGYASLNDASQALTGENSSVDASKKANLLGTLSNVLSLLVGDSIYCVNDEEAALKAESGGFSNLGVLGMISNSTSAMLASYPTVNVADHLAQTFIPGYENNNSTFASVDCTEVCTYNWSLGTYSNRSECVSDCTSNSSALLDGTGYTFAELSGESSSATSSSGNSSSSLNTENNEKAGIVEEKIGNAMDSSLDGIEDVKDALEESVGTEESTDGSLAESQGYAYLQSMKIDVIWKTTRNMAYIFYVVIVIIIGFMIMFRQKIGGQALVTLGNTIPSLIVGLVLVTFSFAIVGFILDLGKVGMNVATGFMTEAYSSAGVDTSQIPAVADLSDNVNKTLEVANSEGIVQTLVSKIPFIGDKLADMLSFGTVGTIGTIAAETGLAIVMNKALDAIKSINWSNINFGDIPVISTAASIAVTVLETGLDVIISIARFGITIFLIKNILLLLISLIVSLKLWVTLLITYLKIFMNVILGPLQIAIGSLPGNSYMTKNWFKSVVANVMVFVGVYIVIGMCGYLGNVLEDAPSKINFFGSTSSYWIGNILPLKSIILLAGYLFASNLPPIIGGFMKVGESKEMGEGMKKMQKDLGKVPLIGGLFGG